MEVYINETNWKIQISPYFQRSEWTGKFEKACQKGSVSKQFSKAYHYVRFKPNLKTNDGLMDISLQNVRGIAFEAYYSVSKNVATEYTLRRHKTILLVWYNHVKLAKNTMLRRFFFSASEAAKADFVLLSDL